MKYSHHIAIDKEVSLRLSAYGLVLVFIAGGLFAQITGANELATNPILILVAIVITMIVHELMHGVCFDLFGGHARYGMGVKYFVLPYAYATSPGSIYTFGQMMLVGLSPFIVLSGILLGLAAWLPASAPYLSVAFVMNFGGAVGDLWLMSRIWKFRRVPGVRFVDEADGIRVEADDKALTHVTKRLQQKKHLKRGSFLHTWLASTLAVLIISAILGAILKFVLPGQDVTIGADQFYLVRYVADERSASATLAIMPILVGGFIFALFFRLLHRAPKI